MRATQTDTNILKFAKKQQNLEKKLQAKSKYYGVATQAQFVPSLQFIFRDDYVVAFPYKCISLIEYTPDIGIYLSIARKTVIVKGHNLERLYNWLCHHKVSWIKESDTGYSIELDDIFISDIIVSKRLV